jgi:hypothetical protein
MLSVMLALYFVSPALVTAFVLAVAVGRGR